MDKRDVLQQIDTYAAINHYLKPYHRHGILKKGQHISNPFLPELQQTPSFNIYPSSSGFWRFKDFATGDEGDVFNLIQRLHRCDFQEALRILSQDFVVDQDREAQQNIALHKGKWQASILSYWSDYGISQEHLVAYRVHPVINYQRPTKNRQSLTIHSTANDPIFAYEITPNCYKLYRPFSRDYKFSWLGTKPTEYTFGWDQLPQKGTTVYITGGEKDVLSLHARQQAAICLNSETAIPSAKLIEALKQRFERVVILYDIDDTGLNKSEEIAKRFGLHRMVLPKKLLDKGGKDISDFFKYGFDLSDHEIVVNNTLPQPGGEHLDLLLRTEQNLTERKAQEVIMAQPLLYIQQQALLFPYTINCLQGKSGVHKSRLAEAICSALLKVPGVRNDLFGLERNGLERPTVCYIDTERNLSDQFPLAIQRILEKAGYTKEETPPNFKYTSLLEVSRPDRFKALTAYIEYLRKELSGHLVLVLDVLTDCVRDFNRPEDSMLLIDLMNKAINKYNVTFIGVIHENPGSIDKARGHLGTELMNKSSIVIQVGFEKGKDNKPTDLIALNFLKCRNSRRFESIYLRYSETAKGLVLADTEMIASVFQSRQTKANISDLMDFLSHHLNEATSGQVLQEQLVDEFDCSSKIIRTRLKEIIDKAYVIKDKEGTLCHLVKQRAGKEMLYTLSPITDTTK